MFRCSPVIPRAQMSFRAQSPPSVLPSAVEESLPFCHSERSRGIFPVLLCGDFSTSFASLPSVEMTKRALSCHSEGAVGGAPPAFFFTKGGTSTQCEVVNPLVQNELRIRGYTHSALRAPLGMTVGADCVSGDTLGLRPRYDSKGFPLSPLSGEMSRACE